MPPACALRRKRRSACAPAPASGHADRAGRRSRACRAQSAVSARRQAARAAAARASLAHGGLYGMQSRRLRFRLRRSGWRSKRVRLLRLLTRFRFRNGATEDVTVSHSACSSAVSRRLPRGRGRSGVIDSNFGFRRGKGTGGALPIGSSARGISITNFAGCLMRPATRPASSPAPK